MTQATRITSSVPFPKASKTILSIADLRLVVDYLRALRNEMAIDRHALALLGLEPQAFGRIPRPSRWVGIARRAPVLSRWIERLSLPLWHLAGPWLFTHQRRQICTPDARRKVAWRADEGGQVLGLSMRAADIVHSNHIDPLPRQWLELPWVPLECLPTGAEVIRAADLLDEQDLARVYRLAVLAHRALQSRRGFERWGLQTYTAWRWFFARLAIDKLPGPLLMVEHFDRWAVAADSSAWATRLHRPDRRLTLMQHGSVNADTPARTLGVSLRTRLRSVSRLHVYSSADEAIFRREVLSEQLGQRGLDVSYFHSMITLTQLADVARPSLLFVGHPLCAHAQMSLMSGLQQARPGLQVFYKPHPTIGAAKQLSSFPWTLVHGRTVFPAVDLILSYPSTMVGEYAALGIDAVVHPLDIKPDAARRLIPEILQKIDARRTAVSSAQSYSSHEPQ